MTGKISENLSAVRLVKAYNAENYEIAQFEELLNDYKVKFVRWRKLSSFFFASSDIFIFASRTVAIIYSVYLAFTHEITAGTVVISYTFVNMMVWPLRNAATSLSNLGQTLAALDRIDALLKVEPEDVTSGLTPEIKGDIRFEHVSFAYPDDPKTKILDDVSFTIKHGESIAIMGKTGSGKSTIGSLLNRLYEPTSGQIYLGDTPLNEIQKKHLRANIAPVLQDPFLFSKTISDNIAIAKPGSDQEAIRAAASAACIDEAIGDFKEGYSTPVGERGVTLSGGQKQRVAIARAIITGAPVFLFDDSLSAVDTATDFAIRSRLKAFRKESTSILITHRVNSAKDCDRIIVIDEGRIEAIGTHEELLKIPGTYSRVAAIQTALEEGGEL